MSKDEIIKGYLVTSQLSVDKLEGVFNQIVGYVHFSIIRFVNVITFSKSANTILSRELELFLH